MGHEVIVQRCVLGKSARGGGPRVQPCGQWFGEARQQRVGLIAAQVDEAGVGQHVQDEGQHQVVEEIFVYEGGGLS